jgi:hypothetical protein
MPYAKAYVEVQQLLDGSWRVYHKNQLIAKHASTALHEPLRALPRNHPLRHLHEMTGSSELPLNRSMAAAPRMGPPSDSSEQPTFLLQPIHLSEMQ